MEPSGSGDPAVAGTATMTEAAFSNGGADYLNDASLIDDDRSSSLSEIDDVSENESSEEEDLQPDRPLAENDSEAETERIEDSPHHIRSRKDILVTAGRFENSPSKLAQSTTFDNLEEDEDPDAEETPSKSRHPSRNEAMTGDVDDDGDDDDDDDDEDDDALEMEDTENLPPPLEITNKKRKRLADDLTADIGVDGPLRKRRPSDKSDAEEDAEIAIDTVLSREETEEVSKPLDASHDGTPAADDILDAESTVPATRGRRGKKGKRKGRKAKDADEETETMADTGEAAAEDALLDDEEAGEVEDEGEDAEVDATAKSEEEMARKVAAMDALVVLEKEFATLRDKIYDERIAKLNQELEQLTNPKPTHPELLRQLECVQRYRDSKIKYEHTLFQYRLQSLLNKSLAERAQVHSTFFQRIRDVREAHSAAVSKQFYAIQHDRFKTEELSTHHYIPFPTRRSQQIYQQTAYNQEVSVLAGVAKYVGFPAAPSLAPARQSEIEEDFEKMGIAFDHRQALAPIPPISRGTMPAISSSVPHERQEDALLEHTSWSTSNQLAQQQHNPKQGGRIVETGSHTGFTTPASQKHVVDIHAPNGSASTIPENPSAPSSSAANTPYSKDQEARSVGHGQSGADLENSARKSGYRSQSSSPLDVRKSQPSHAYYNDHRSIPTTSQDTRPEPNARHAAYSPPTRMGFFNPNKREDSPPLLPKSLNTLHTSPSLATSTNTNRMTAR